MDFQKKRKQCGNNLVEKATGFVVRKFRESVQFSFNCKKKNKKKENYHSV